MNAAAIKDFLLSHLAGQLSPQGLSWLQKQLEDLKSEKEFYLAFSRAPRFTGKHTLSFSPADLQEAARLRPGFQPSGWTTDQAARTVLVLSVPHGSPADYEAILNKVFSTADLQELAALYAALPLLPYPEQHRARAAEGVRSNMTQVFDAIALDNPYPHDYMSEEAWNQLVLKSIFNSRPLYRIYGLDARRNAHLAHMLVDYAHERWAAGRTLTPELWRMVGPFVDAGNLKDIQRLFRSPETIQHEAAALALSESSLPAAQELLHSQSELHENIRDGRLNWQIIGESAYSN
jgi:hypothetical protein